MKNVPKVLGPYLPIGTPLKILSYSVYIALALFIYVKELSNVA